VVKRECCKENVVKRMFGRFGVGMWEIRSTHKYKEYKRMLGIRFRRILKRLEDLFDVEINQTID
jgi:hypothetical protein